MDISYTFLNGKLIIGNWEIFLMNGLFIFLASFLVYFIDESLKFLIVVDSNKEALDVFQNTGN